MSPVPRLLIRLLSILIHGHEDSVSVGTELPELIQVQVPGLVLVGAEEGGPHLLRGAGNVIRLVEAELYFNIILQKRQNMVGF